MEKHNDKRSNRRISLWLVVAMLAQAFGIGTTRNATFAAATGSLGQGQLATVSAVSPNLAPMVATNTTTSTPISPTATPTPICPSSWTEQAPYPIVILDNAVASQGGLIYSFSGISSRTLITNSYRYDPSANSWTAIAPLPAAREGASAVSDGTYVYILGGEDSTGANTTTLYRYDPVTNSYTTLAPFTYETYAQTAVYRNGNIYKLGGCTTDCIFPRPETECYNIASNTWSTVSSLPEARAWLSAVALGGYVYVAGGTMPDASAKAYRYDPNTNTWDDAGMADLPDRRWGAASAILNGKLLLAGGFVGGSSTPSSSAVLYDPSTDTWTSIDPMLVARAHMSGANIGPQFYAVGGEGPTDPDPETGNTNNQRYINTCPPTNTPTITPTFTPTSTSTPCGPTSTPVTIYLIGHVTWQGSTQPNSRQIQPITATLLMTNPVVSQIDPILTTDASGFFTVPIASLYPGTYQLRVKGPRSLANSGSLVLSGSTVSVEMGTMLPGDANNDNIINAQDFTILKNTFGKACGQPGYNDRADFNNDCIVNAQDFTLLKNNFGRAGSPVLCSACPSGPAISELFGCGNPVEGQTTLGCSPNTATGNMSASSTDLSVPGRGPALMFARTYNALGANTRSTLGYGWTHNYNMFIEGSANPVVHQENGSTASFTGSGSPGSAYTHDARVLAELFRNLDSTYVFTHTQGLMRYTFNAQGKLTEIRDRNNYATTLSYDGSGQLQTVTDPAGRSLTLAYGCGLLIGVTDPGSRTVSFTYDPNGNFSSVTDVAGNVTHYNSYDANHRLLTRTDPNGGTTSNLYDGLGRVTSQTDPMSRITQFAYGVQFPNNTTTITDPRNNVTRHTYLSNRLVSAVQNPGAGQQATWQFAWGGGGSYVSGLTSMTDPLTHTWSNTLDTRGNTLTSTDPLSRITHYAYNAANDLLAVTDTLGISTTYTYDGGGSPLSMTRSLTQTNQLAVTTYAYDPLRPGDALTMTNPLNKTWRNTYNVYGYYASSTDPLTHTTNLTSDILGRTLSATNPRGLTSTIAYDAYGDPTVMTDALAYHSNTTYDANHNPLSTRDAGGHVTTYTYNWNNERTRETRPDGTHSDTAYDSAGNVISKTNGLGQTTLYSYDSFNRLATITDALNRTTTYAYDLAGQLTGITDAQGRTTTFGYNAANELTSINYSDGTMANVTFGYDTKGRRTRMTDGTGTSLYTYDSLNRLIRSQDGAGKVVSYSYDLAGNLTGLVYPNNSLTVTYGYDAANRLTSVNDGLGHTTQYGYDPDSDPISITYPNGVIAALGYDAGNQITSINHSRLAVTILSLTYGRVGSGLLASANESGVGISGVETHNYSHDGLNRLLSDQLSSASSSIQGWAYDGAYQIPQTGYQLGANPLTMGTRTHDAANELTQLVETNGGAPTKNLGFLYNLNGDRIQRIDNLGGPTINYTYDQADHLTNFNGVAQYSYNGAGLRMSKTQNAVTEQFTWNVNGGLPMLLQDGSAQYIFGVGQAPLEEVTNGGQVYYYHTDQQGSVRALTDGLGQVANTYTYDPYGTLTAFTGTVSNPFGYTGEYTDAESGLVYLRARYYDPATQQFLTVDPLVAQTRQAYAYVSDNPVNASDPTGLWPHWPWPWYGAIVVLVIIIVIVVVILVGMAPDSGNSGSNGGMGTALGADAGSAGFAPSSASAYLPTYTNGPRPPNRSLGVGNAGASFQSTAPRAIPFHSGGCCWVYNGDPAKGNMCELQCPCGHSGPLGPLPPR